MSIASKFDYNAIQKKRKKNEEYYNNIKWIEFDNEGPDVWRTTHTEYVIYLKVLKKRELNSKHSAYMEVWCEIILRCMYSKEVYTITGKFGGLENAKSFAIYITDAIRRAYW